MVLFFWPFSQNNATLDDIFVAKRKFCRSVLPNINLKNRTFYVQILTHVKPNRKKGDILRKWAWLSKERGSEFLIIIYEIKNRILLIE